MVHCVYAIIVCLPHCQSMTSRHYTEMAKCRIMQTMPHDSPATSFLTPKISAKLKRVIPNGDAKCRWCRWLAWLLDNLRIRQLADWTTRGLDISRTGQLAD